MTLETQVQALTVATESLLQSVNTRKADLDAAQTAAADSANAASNSAVLAATNGAEQVALASQQAVTATTQASIATTKANLLGSVATVTATGTVNIALADAVYQLINPNGANRNVVLADLTAAEIGYSHPSRTPAQRVTRLPSRTPQVRGLGHWWRMATALPWCGLVQPGRFCNAGTSTDRLNPRAVPR